MKNEKYIRNQLKKIKKKWPTNLRPKFRQDGIVQIVATFNEDSLNEQGVTTLASLYKKRKQLEHSVFKSSTAKKHVKDLGILYKELPQLTDSLTALQLLEEFFPESTTDIVIPSNNQKV